MDTKKIDPDIIAKAKELYMDYVPVIQIATTLNTSRNSIQNYVNKEWKAERELNRSELFQELSKAKKAHFMKLTQSAIVVLSRALDDLAKRETPPTVKEARDVSCVMEALDKITRLDESSPTEIHAQERVVTVVELKNKMLLDPFTSFDDVKESGSDFSN